MKKKLLIVIFVSMCGTVLSQKHDDFVNNFVGGRQLKESLQKEKLLEQDISSFLITKEIVFGFLGVNKQRIDVRILSAIRNQLKTNQYYIYGKLKKGDSINEFQGELVIFDLKKIGNQDENYLLSANYFFYEKNRKNILEGLFLSKLSFSNNVLNYDLSDVFNNKHMNNAFVGVRKFVDGNEVDCNWAYYTPPYAGDLDIGVTDFVPNPKYKDYGWKVVIDDINQAEGGLKLLSPSNNWWDECHQK